MTYLSLFRRTVVALRTFWATLYEARDAAACVLSVVAVERYIVSSATASYQKRCVACCGADRQLRYCDAASADRMRYLGESVTMNLLIRLTSVASFAILFGKSYRSLVAEL